MGKLQLPVPASFLTHDAAVVRQQVVEQAILHISRRREVAHLLLAFEHFTDFCRPTVHLVMDVRTAFCVTINRRK